MKLPCLLQQLLSDVLTGETDKESPSSKVQLLVQSISKDLFYATTRGTQMSPKYFLLSDGIKTLIGNTELIHMVNMLRHGVSYSQLEINDTALCLQKLAATQNHQVVLPTHLKYFHIFSQLWHGIILTDLRRD